MALTPVLHAYGTLCAASEMCHRTQLDDGALFAAHHLMKPLLPFRQRRLTNGVAENKKAPAWLPELFCSRASKWRIASGNA
jgi:hypothetical protein